MSTAPRTNSSLEFQLNRAVASLFRERASGRKVTYAELLSDKMLIIAAIRIGIPYSLFELILKYTPFSEADWASFLNISTKSLQRYEQSRRYHFKPLQSEKIIELAEVTRLGLDVFGNMEKFRLWLDAPNYALGNMKPVELLRDSYGNRGSSAVAFPLPSRVHELAAAVVETLRHEYSIWTLVLHRAEATNVKELESAPLLGKLKFDEENVPPFVVAMVPSLKSA
jgi:putative toxin-antitoxin system antitoxin component (TIGR02293 family)